MVGLVVVRVGVVMMCCGGELRCGAFRMVFCGHGGGDVVMISLSSSSSSPLPTIISVSQRCKLEFVHPIVQEEATALVAAVAAAVDAAGRTTQ